jgi:hypothetical protein
MDKDELQPISTMLPSQEQPQQVSVQMEQSGGEGRQFGYVQKYESTNNTTVLMIPGNEADDDDDTPDEEIEVDFSCYNLFVITDEQFRGKYFVVPKIRAISESTPPDLMELADLTPDKIAIVKKYPAIFANQNHLFARTDDSHKAFFGIIRDIQIKEEGIWIYFHKMRKVKQQIFNEHAADFGIEGTEFKNELDCTHWSIKKVNVLETLEKAGHKITLI